MDRIIRILIGLVCLFCIPGFPWAGCPVVPHGLTLPGTQRTQVDMARELGQPWQAGGEIVLFCDAEEHPLAGRLSLPPNDKEEELARRAELFALVRLINLARKGELSPRSLALAPAQIAFLERFALSDAGAVWFREVADDTLRLFNAGYLEYDRALWESALTDGRVPKLSGLLSGRLTEAGEFAANLLIFKFGAYPGAGAMAQPGCISLGNEGMKCQFPTSNELVDPYAVLSHEFGHTRYGDPTSAATLLGEARTVERYENPIRVHNGYEPRSVYFQRNDQGNLVVRKDSLLERLKFLEKEKGISIQDLRALERYHCDCPGPLPVILECEVRERAKDQEPTEASSEHDCRLQWKTDLLPPPFQLFQQ